MPQPPCWLAYERIKAGKGEPSSITMFGPADHGELILRLVSETHKETFGRGRTVCPRRPNHLDNHLWGCVVGKCASTSEQKLTRNVLQAAKPKKRKLTGEEIQALREARRNGR